MTALGFWWKSRTWGICVTVPLFEICGDAFPCLTLWMLNASSGSGPSVITPVYWWKQLLMVAEISIFVNEIVLIFQLSVIYCFLKLYFWLSLTEITSMKTLKEFQIGEGIALWKTIANRIGRICCNISIFGSVLDNNLSHYVSMFVSRRHVLCGRWLLRRRAWLPRRWPYRRKSLSDVSSICCITQRLTQRSRTYVVNVSLLQDWTEL